MMIRFLYVCDQNFVFYFIVRSRFGSRAKFEMVEVADEDTKPSITTTTNTASSFPASAPKVTSAVLKANRKKMSKKN